MAPANCRRNGRWRALRRSVPRFIGSLVSIRHGRAGLSTLPIPTQRACPITSPWRPSDHLPAASGSICSQKRAAKRIFIATPADEPPKSKIGSTATHFLASSSRQFFRRPSHLKFSCWRKESFKFRCGRSCFRSCLSRGLRYLVEGILAVRYGDAALRFMISHSAAFGIAIVVAMLLLFLISRLSLGHPGDPAANRSSSIYLREANRKPCSRIRMSSSDSHAHQNVPRAGVIRSETRIAQFELISVAGSHHACKGNRAYFKNRCAAAVCCPASSAGESSGLYCVALCSGSNSRPTPNGTPNSSIVLSVDTTPRHSRGEVDSGNAPTASATRP